MHPHIGLVVTCLAEIFRPNAIQAAVRVLEWAGCQVSVPRSQTCCSQPAYNLGDLKQAGKVAGHTVDVFEGYDYVVTLSSSCAKMMRTHYSELFPNDESMRARAESLSSRTYDFVSFLTDVLRVHEREQAEFDALQPRSPASSNREGKASMALDVPITYHDSCSSLRGLGLEKQPRLLLSKVAGAKLVEMADREVCCGFGGTFSIKYPELSCFMGNEKVGCVQKTSASILVGADLGCLLHLEGCLARQAGEIRVAHIAELLAPTEDISE